MTNILYGAGAEGDTIEITDSGKETWIKVPEKVFLPVWKKAVLSQLDTRNEEYDMVKTDLARAVDLYQSIQKSTDPISNIQQNLDVLSQAILTNSEIEKKYSFDFINAYETYQTGMFYISGILENAYDNNVLEKSRRNLIVIVNRRLHTG